MTANKEHASEILPLLRNIEIERTWAGIMPFSRDGKPIIGKLEAGLPYSALFDKFFETASGNHNYMKE